MRTFGVLALLIMGGLAWGQAEGGAVSKVVRRHGWLYGSGYHAYNCPQQCPVHGSNIYGQPTVLPVAPPESIVAPPRVGFLPQRYPVGYPLVSQAPSAPAIPLSGIQPIRLPLTTPEAAMPPLNVEIHHPAATAREIFQPPPTIR